MENETKKIGGWKTKFKLIILLLIILFGLYIYFWYQGVQKLNDEAQTRIDISNEYSIIKSEISAEYERCQQILTKSEGNFEDFAYCKKYINWNDSLSS